MVSSPDMLRSAVERSLLRDERPLLLDELQISSSNIGAQGGGVDTLKHLLGLSPDLPATIKCRYNDVKVPAETFRIITVQDLAKLHHNLTTWRRFALRTSYSKGLSVSSSFSEASESFKLLLKDKARLAANLEDLKFLKHKMNSLYKNDPVWTKKIEELANACLDSFLEDPMPMVCQGC